MEAIAGILGISYGLLILIGLPYLFFSYFSLRDKNNALESRLRDLESQLDRVRDHPISQTETDSTEHAPAPDQAAQTAWYPETTHDVQSSTVPVYAQSTSPAQSDHTAASGFYVFNTENLTRLKSWLSANWTLAIAALSLILGGVFMVQYGVENGLLTPKMRVLGALLLASGLIAGGEFLRRRHGDVEHNTLQHLPSTLAGAGVVVAFVAILSAHALYDLIGPVLAFSGLALLSVLAIALGWIYGPVLSAIGLVGASAAPFLIQTESKSALLLYPYFALIALMGLSIDSLKRWAWVSALALLASSIALVLIWLADPHALALAGAALVIGLGAVCIPNQHLLPQHAGPSLIDQFLRRDKAHFTSLLAAAGVVIIAGAAMLVALTSTSQSDSWLGIFLLVLLSFLGFFGLRYAPALHVLGLIGPSLFLVCLVLLALIQGPIFAAESLTSNNSLMLLTALSALISLFGYYRLRSLITTDAAIFWVVGTAGFLPVSIFLLEFFWAPSDVIGTSRWAMMVVFSAALLIGFARHRAGLSGQDTFLHCGFFSAGAIVLIALVAFILLTKTALSLGLGVVIVLTALLDRRWPMPPLAWVIQIGIAVIVYRLIVDPGIDWSLQHASAWDFYLVHLGSLLALGAVWFLLPADRALVRSVAESSAFNLLAVFLTVLLARLIGAEDFQQHWGYGLSAFVWFSTAFAQLWRYPYSQGLARRVRLIFAALSSLLGIVLLAQVISSIDALTYSGELVLGPPVLDSLALAFLPLALLAAAGAVVLEKRNATIPDWCRPSLISLSAMLFLLWGWLEIRRLWRGPDLSVAGPSDGELYSYTVAMLILSLAGLALAFLKRSRLLQKIAMIGVALTIAKVFLIDMSGLSGLVRVAAFVGLGLALTALAWFNRVINTRWSDH